MSFLARLAPGAGRPRRIAVALALCIATTSHAAPSCPLLRAHYHLSSSPAYTVSFVRMPADANVMSDVALKLSVADGRHWWFFFDEGSAHYISMISTTDPSAAGWRNDPDDSGRTHRPLGEMHYFAWSGAYQFDETLPKANTAAPQRIFLPDLSERLWHGLEQKLSVRYGVFEFDGCAPR